MRIHSEFGSCCRRLALSALVQRLGRGSRLVLLAWIAGAGLGAATLAEDGFVGEPDSSGDVTVVEPIPGDDSGFGGEGDGTVMTFGGGDPSGDTSVEDGNTPVDSEMPDDGSTDDGPGRGWGDNGEDIEPNWRTLEATSSPGAIPDVEDSDNGGGDDSDTPTDPPDPIIDPPVDWFDNPDDWLLYFLAGSSTNSESDPQMLSMMARAAIVQSAHTSNQLAVARTLFAVGGQATGDVDAMIQELQGLTAPEQRAALDSLSGEAYGTLSSINLQIADRSLRAITNRLINSRLFLTDGDAALLTARGPRPASSEANQLVRGQSPVFGAAGWVQGYGSRGDWSSNGGLSGADYRSSGFAYGIDLAGDDSGVVGISGGHGYTDFGTDQRSSGDVNSHQIGLYLLKQFESFYGLGVVNLGHNRNHVSRLVTVGGIQQRTASAFSGHQFGAYTELGKNFDTSYLRFQPFLGLQYLSVTNNSAYEGPVGGVGLKINGNSTETLQTHLGLRTILQPLQHRSGIELRPYLNTRWVADLLGSDASTTATLVGAPAGASWTVTGNHSGRHLGMVGPGLTAQLTDSVSLFGNFDYQFGSNFNAYTGSGGVLFEF